MKINFTYNKMEYTICTIKEFAEILAEKAYKEETSGKTKFIADFTTIDIEDNEAIDINNIGDYAETATGWCGVKELGEIGFNDTAKQFVFDYYGGNQMIMNTFPDEYMKEDCADEIIDSLCYTLDIDKTNIDWYVLVQWTQDECLKKDEQEAVKPIENAAVTNFAEMLCDYVSGLDEGEGIGREDIIDHLYEYINWDKRFTREYEEGKKNFKPFNKGE